MDGQVTGVYAHGDCGRYEVSTGKIHILLGGSYLVVFVLAAQSRATTEGSHRLSLRGTSWVCWPFCCDIVGI
jgi:hypothetical protein